ncbi:MAG: HAD hydrolase-like protein [Candidatus Dormibacteraeota bacterium]|nr:HAD hydrolase-like protein [Candidatus Dormibacteraeota bacterium]
MRPRQHLVIDGDDTLWENNVFFEDAAEAFIDFLGHSSLSRDQVRAALDEVERLNIANHGYGSAAFGRNLQETYHRLAERDVKPEDLEHLMELARKVVSQPMRLRPGVEPTLVELASRHDLTLFTKGEQDEQTLKVERSGLETLFNRVVVTPEKDVAAYQELVAEHGFDPHSTWMVGNSPRSDINPPLAAGLGAVFIPHPQTWSLEVVDVTESDRLLVLESFDQLLEHF